MVLLIAQGALGQSLYFPPIVGETWETVTPAELGWCEDGIDDLYTLLEDNDTKAFILLKDGRIVLERYFGTFTTDSLWYWASAGKTLTGFLIGMAQEQGFLDIDDPTSLYLGAGWTSCPPAEEMQRTIRHQLTMTTGLDDGAGDVDCTLPECLTCLAAPGTRWAYHNAPYTLLDGVLEGATGQNLNAFIQSQLRIRTGINGLFIKLGYNNVFFSRPRHMARFGLLLLADGVWSGTTILADTAYLHASHRSSQDLNKSYGYLTWLNGQESYMVPGLQFVLPGSMMPDAPDNLYAALGKYGQYINVVPDQGLVLIRMGNNPEAVPVPYLFNNLIWQKLNDILCPMTATESPASDDQGMHTSFAGGILRVQWPHASYHAQVYDVTGRLLASGAGMDGTCRIPLPPGAGGMVVLRGEAETGGRVWQATEKLVVGR